VKCRIPAWMSAKCLRVEKRIGNMQGVREHIDDRLKFEGLTGRGTGEPSVTRSASCDATPEVNGPVGV